MDKSEARKQPARESRSDEWEIISSSTFVIFLVTFCVLLGLCGCQRSIAAASFSFAPGQLMYGFYAPETGGWRWVARSFAVALTPPHGMSSGGARLTVRLFLPENEIQTIGPLTLSAS